MNRPLGVLVLLVASMALGCPKKPAATGATKPVAWKVSKSGEGFRLSEADDDASRESVPLAKATVLSAADTQKVIARLPPLKGELDDEKDFALRDKSVPAPRTGKTGQGAFP